MKTRYRVTGTYMATMTVDVMAESKTEAEEKARNVFEAADADDFAISDELEMDAYLLYEDEKEASMEIDRPNADNEAMPIRAYVDDVQNAELEPIEMDTIEELADTLNVGAVQFDRNIPYYLIQRPVQ